jgi:hypothetical protein
MEAIPGNEGAAAMSFGDAILTLIVVSAIPISFWLSHRFEDVEDDARKMMREKGHKPFGG